MPTPRSLLHNLDERLAEIQRLKLALEAKKQSKRLQDPVAWTLYHRTIKGQAFTFQDRDYLLPLYRDRHPKVLVVKARQLELTELAVNWLLFNLITYPYTTGLYTSPRFDQVSRFSKDRLKKAVKESPTLRDLIPDTGDVTRLPFPNGSVLYMYSAWGDFDAIRNIPGDFAVVDEFQDVQQEALPVLQEAMSHSKYQKLLTIGTGSDVGSTFDRIWQSSDMKEWDSSAKAWIPHRPENQIYSGYHFTQLMAPWITPEQIEAKRRDPAYSERRFVNEVLGLFHKGLRRPITPEDVRACLDRSTGLLGAGTGRGPVFVGVDWGGGISGFTVVWILEKDGDIWRTLYIYKFTERDLMKQAEIIANLILQFNALRCVADIGYGATQVGYLQSRFASRVLACQYTQRPETPLEVDWEKMTVKADRSFNLERTIDIITKQKLAIPYADPSAVEWCFDHLTNIEAQDTQTVSGRNYRRYIHPEGQPDDALHALTYALIASLVDVDSRIYGI